MGVSEGRSLSGGERGREHQKTTGGSGEGDTTRLAVRGTRTFVCGRVSEVSSPSLTPRAPGPTGVVGVDPVRVRRRGKGS